MICKIDYLRTALRMHQDDRTRMEIVCLAHVIRGNPVMYTTESFPGQDLLFGKTLGIESEIAIRNKNYLVFF